MPRRYLAGTDSPDRDAQASLTPAHGRVSLSLLAGHAHVNVHGGEVMRLVDSTAGAVAGRHSGGPAVTTMMDEMAFLAQEVRRMREAEIRRAHRLASKAEILASREGGTRP